MHKARRSQTWVAGGIDRGIEMILHGDLFLCRAAHPRVKEENIALETR